MTTKPYSIDLRKKVINYIENGNSQLEASTLFGLHKNTVNRWWSRYKKEGILSARRRPGFRSKVDHKGMAEYVIANSNVKLYELGKIYKITASQASRILSKLGFSYKKKPSPMWKQARSEERSTSKRSRT